MPTNVEINKSSAEVVNRPFGRVISPYVKLYKVDGENTYVARAKIKLKGDSFGDLVRGLRSLSDCDVCYVSLPNNELQDGQYYRFSKGSGFSMTEGKADVFSLSGLSLVDAPVQPRVVTVAPKTGEQLARERYEAAVQAKIAQLSPLREGMDPKVYYALTIFGNGPVLKKGEVVAYDAAGNTYGLSHDQNGAPNYRLLC